MKSPCEILWKGVLEPLTHVCTDLKISKESSSGAPRRGRGGGWGGARTWEEPHSWVIQPIPENFVITWPYADRPPEWLSVRTTGKPMFTFTLSNYFGSPGENWLHINVVINHGYYRWINWQLSKQGIRWPVSPDRIAGSGVDPSRSSTFLKLSADKLLVFNY